MPKKRITLNTFDEQLDIVLDCASRGAYSSSVFGGHVTGSSTFGVFKINESTDENQETSYSAVQIAGGIDSKIVDIAYRQSDNRLMFATSTNVYTCRFDGVSAYAVENVLAVNGRSETGSISKIVLLNDDAEYSSTSTAFLVLTATGKIMHPLSGQNALLNEKWRLLSTEDIKVNDIVAFNGTAYCATSAGLCKIEDNVLKKVDLLHAANIRKLTVHEGSLWYGDDDGNLLVCDIDDAVQQYHKFDAEVIGVVFAGDENAKAKVIATRDGLFYEKTDDFDEETQYVEMQPGLSCSGIDSH